MAKLGRPKAVGPGSTPLSAEAYAIVVHMYAQGQNAGRILRHVHRHFPQHRSDGSSPVGKRTIRHIRESRQDEIKEVRRRLIEATDDLWITNPRTRLEILQVMFEDANRLTPKRVIEYQESEGGPHKAMVIYEKDFGALLKILDQAYREVGADAGSRVAQSLEDLVRQVEHERGLSEGEIVDVVDVDSERARVLDHATVVDAPRIYPTSGADPKYGLLAGDAGLDEDVVEDEGSS